MGRKLILLLEVPSWTRELYVFIVYPSFYDALRTLKLRRQVTCEMFISEAFRRPCAKNNISGYIWHKLVIQSVKFSFFKQIIVYLSFYGQIFWSVLLLRLNVLCTVAGTQASVVSRSAVKFRSNLLRLQWNIVVAQTIGLEKYRWKMGPNQISLIIVEYYRLNCCRSRSPGGGGTAI